MSDTVTKVDFGKGRNEARRAFARLAGIVEKQEADFLNDPTVFFKRASEEIAKRDAVIRAARDALRPTLDLRPYDSGPVEYTPIKTIVVDSAYLERLNRCAAIIRDYEQ